MSEELIQLDIDCPGCNEPHYQTMERGIYWRACIQILNGVEA